MMPLKQLWKLCLVLWASPYSIIGLTIGVLGIVTGGKGRQRLGAIEFYGGATAWLVRRLPTGPTTLGMTLGHVIIGQTAEGLDFCALHERVHVRQFERWGLLMGPAYLLSSAWQWWCGRDAYRDNPFERQAYREAP
ncbi:MAG: hypothetical protein ACTHOU_10245 [Aureliella sp.]